MAEGSSYSCDRNCLKSKGTVDDPPRVQGVDEWNLVQNNARQSQSDFSGCGR